MKVAYMTLETERAVVSPSTEPLDDLLEIYRRHGFDAGYHQALRDQLEGLVQQAEDFLRSRAGDESTRRTVYRFVEQLERQLMGRSPLSGQEGFVAGAGI
jgi:hypothetical protein